VEPDPPRGFSSRARNRAIAGVAGALLLAHGALRFALGEPLFGETVALSLAAGALLLSAVVVGLLASR
jgi:hypothetical protein